MPSIDITLTVRGVPKAQPRTAATAICPKGCPGNCGGGKKPRPIIRMYTPDKSGAVKAWKQAIMLAIKPYVPLVPHDRPIIVTAKFYFKRPQRMMRKMDINQIEPHTVKPDPDNLEKAVLDAITQSGFWKDDCVAFSVHVTKYYTDKGQGTGAEIRIRSLEADNAANAE